MDVTKATDKPVKNFLPVSNNYTLTPLHLTFCSMFFLNRLFEIKSKGELIHVTYLGVQSFKYLVKYHCGHSPSEENVTCVNLLCSALFPELCLGTTLLL